MTVPPAPLADDDDGAPRRPSFGRRVATTLYTGFAIVTVLALIAAGFVVWTIQRSFPQLDGAAAAPGLRQEVTVQRDELGVPTITASNTHDLFYAQGYVHAQDRFWEMDFRRHVTSGRLSELFGESQVATDTFLRTLGWHAIAEVEAESLDETTRSYYDAYAEGVNAYLADREGADVSLEYAVLELQNPDYVIEPWTPADSIAWFKAMAWDLRSNVEDETERAITAQDLTAEQIAELYPSYPFDRNPVIVPRLMSLPDIATASHDAESDETASTASASIEWTEVGSVIEAVGTLVGDAGEGIGSNSWVISGNLTETGMPLLVNDPHLGASLPSVWHQVQLRCAVVDESCPFDVAGFSFSGLPGIIIGHNARVAWGFTNLTSDVTDLYVEKLEGDAYWRDGELVPLETRTETIRVAGGEDVTIQVRSTVHGPVVSEAAPDFATIASQPYVGRTDAAVQPSSAPTGEYAVSLRWTALEPGTTASALFALNTATDFGAFRAAASLFDVPAQNLVYADVDGNIGYQTPGSLPVRGKGDGSMPMPGWSSAYDWQGYIPFENLPVLFNPDDGYIVTANNAVVTDDYGYALTSDWDYGWRAARITELIERRIAETNSTLTAEQMRDILADDEFFMGKRLAAVFLTRTSEDPAVDAALDLLRTWDAHNAADSAAAAYANVLWDELVRNLFVLGRESAAPISDQSRLFLLVDDLFDDPESSWWTNQGLGVSGMDEMLERSASDAYRRLAAVQGAKPSRWDWGSLHTLELRSETFGESGIAPIELLFNRGPYPTSGGTSLVNATGWRLGGDFSTVTVPSMRMIVDLSDFDASSWHILTGTSGHAFHPNYIDQTEAWQQVRLTPWAFSREAVAAATTNTLTLTPAG
ncbi:penicillin acylase family protein [Microbacterium thalassium]|uniref:Penicillin amidase n=1 Tax=Microbacterium thalassium TaxID=362649 RepID=A0A7X0KTM1_9MICO|nr:penicillin acylase family protein [Microbacterium thalassium]MBB6390242.1 penicillin amidase [Microbacterium thalassium]